MKRGTKSNRPAALLKKTYIYVKVKVNQQQATKTQRGSRGIALLRISLTSALNGGGCSTPRPDRFNRGKDQVPIVQEAGWGSGPVWTGAENLTPTVRVGYIS